MALNSLSGSRCALWPALLQMSWPKPAWFGSPALAAAKSGNEVNERVVLGHFPLISTQLKSNSGSDLRHRTFQCSPSLLGFQDIRQEMTELGDPEQRREVFWRENGT